MSAGQVRVQHDERAAATKPGPARRMGAVPVQRCRTAQPGEDLWPVQRHAGNHAVGQMVAAGPGGRSQGPDPAALLRAGIADGGVALDPQLRALMQARLGHGFDHVRIHTGPSAQASAAAVGAEAYTTGSHVVFAAGRFAPHTPAGILTLAHELVHVVQQQRGPVDGRPTGSGLRVSDPGDRFEVEAAETAVAAMTSQGPHGHTSRPAPHLAQGGTGPTVAASVQRCGGIDPDQCPCHGNEVTGGEDKAVARFVQRQPTGQTCGIDSIGPSGPVTVQRQGAGHPGVSAPAAPGAPAEKWSQTLEGAYRRVGDHRRAAAIRMCRERGAGACDLVLTQSEVQRLYDIAHQARGNEQRIRAEAPRAVPMLGLLAPLPPTAPPVTIPGLPPPSVPLGPVVAPPGAGLVPGAAPLAEAGGAAATGEGAAVAGGISTGAVAATGVLAIVGICVIAGIQLWQMAKFQAELEARGFIILDDPLSVCIRGCHTSPVPLPKPWELTEPPPTFDLPPRVSARERELLRRWLEKTPTPTRTPKPNEQPRPTPRVRPGDPDTEDEDRKGCHGTATFARGGNTCHDQFATSVSGVSREWLVTTPSGLSESYDARGADGHTLYEMKTGYGFLGLRNPTRQQQLMIDRTRERWQAQSALQQAVADRCGYNLVWYFSNRAAEQYASGIIQPRTVHVPFRCDVDGERGL